MPGNNELLLLDGVFLYWPVEPTKGRRFDLFTSARRM
jgi:hypothetical protein